MPGTVKLHRVFATRPEKVYRAFLDPDAKARWLPPNGFTGKVQHDDPKVGGKYHMSFTNFSTGTVSGFGGEYLELVPNEKLRYSDKFDDPNMPGTITVTVTLKEGDFFGEMGLLSAQPRNADVVANGYSHLLVLHKKDFNQLLSRKPEVRAAIEEVAARRA